MIATGNLTEEQMTRLKKAREVKKFGALETWQELFIYQLTCGRTDQIMEIGKWAAKNNKGQMIKLPLKDNV